ISLFAFLWSKARCIVAVAQASGRQLQCSLSTMLHGRVPRRDVSGDEFDASAPAQQSRIGQPQGELALRWTSRFESLRELAKQLWESSRLWQDEIRYNPWHEQWSQPRLTQRLGRLMSRIVASLSQCGLLKRPAVRRLPRDDRRFDRSRLERSHLNLWPER